jgi:hypothetical protein
MNRFQSLLSNSTCVDKSWAEMPWTFAAMQPGSLRGEADMIRGHDGPPTPAEIDDDAARNGKVVPVQVDPGSSPY